MDLKTCRYLLKRIEVKREVGDGNRCDDSGTEIRIMYKLWLRHNPLQTRFMGDKATNKIRKQR